MLYNFVNKKKHNQFYFVQHQVFDCTNIAVDLIKVKQCDVLDTLLQVVYERHDVHGISHRLNLSDIRPSHCPIHSCFVSSFSLHRTLFTTIYFVGSDHQVKKISPPMPMISIRAKCAFMNTMNRTIHLQKLDHMLNRSCTVMCNVPN